MALESINVGNFVNDGTGDDLRTAFIKINNNFEELDLQGGQANTISNIGTGTGLYKEKIGVDLRLKTLVAGPGITITNNPNDLTITNNRNMIVTVNANTGSLTATSPTQAISIVGSGGITTSITGSTLTINGTNAFRLQEDTSPKLGGELDLNGFDIVGGTGVTIDAENFVGHLTGTLNGNVTGLVYGIDVRELENTFMDFDFGNFTNQITSPLQLFLVTSNVDMGSFVSPNPLGIDLGTFI